MIKRFGAVLVLSLVVFLPFLSCPSAAQFILNCADVSIAGMPTIPSLLNCVCPLGGPFTVDCTGSSRAEECRRLCAESADAIAVEFQSGASAAAVGILSALLVIYFGV